MDKNQNRGGRASRGRGRSSTTTRMDPSLHPPPTGSTFRQPLLAGGSHHAGDRPGSSSHDHEEPPHDHEAENDHEEENDEQSENQPEPGSARADGAKYIIPDGSGTG